MIVDQPKKLTKTAFVRSVLKDIGALTSDPPEGWRQKVEDALVRQNMTMHQVTIYQIRQRAMKEGEDKQPAKRGRKPGPQQPKSIQTVPVATSKLTLADLQSVQTFSKTVGGIEALAEACKAIQAFKG